MFNLVRVMKSVNMAVDAILDPKYKKLLMRISKNIKKARIAHGLTQEEMTQKGFNYRHYQKLESGTYSFTLHTLQRLALALNVEIKTFFD